jgi:glycerol-3-phosphate dehydrogenase (NAD(P)+)
MGSGSWGTALSLLLARNDVCVSLWGRDEDEARAIRRNRENRRYLPGIELPAAIEATSSPPDEADLWVLAVPSDGIREVCSFLPQGSPVVVTAAKGLEPETGKRMSEVLLEERPSAQAFSLSGPNLAVELARGIPTATVIASKQIDRGEWVRDRFMCRCLRVYTSHDVAGVELGGALKNVMAIGAGISDGLGFGDNTKGALLARGLHEMAELGTALGAELGTFLGLSGVGDLFATAVSGLSRNYRVGRALGAGADLGEALNDIGQVAEGVPTSEAAVKLAHRVGVDVPLMESICKVIAGKKKPLEAVAELMERAPKAEV